MPPRDLTQYLHSPGSIPAPPQEIVVGIPAELLRRRPDVQQAERAAAQQSAEIGVAEADFYPHISITGTIGAQSEDLPQLFQRQSLSGQLGPGVSWNILNYGRISNNVAAQNARFQQALLTYRDTVLRANEEVENNIIAYLTEQDRVVLLTGNARAAAKAAQLASQQYLHGAIDYQPLLDAERVLVQQEDALAQSRSAVGLDLINVYRALGGGWKAGAAGGLGIGD
jgi:outer membrane protein TolC